MGGSGYKVDFQQVREMRLSVIIPIYNVEGYLSRCLDSVIVALGQLDVGWEAEVICIDDGSKDGSSAILRDYANCDSRIKLIEQENRGLAAARNVGLDIAVGDWISFVDSDDWVEARYFKALLTAAESEGAQMSSVCTRTCPPEEYWCSHRGIPATAWGKAYRASLATGGIRTRANTTANTDSDTTRSLMPTSVLSTNISTGKPPPGRVTANTSATQRLAELVPDERNASVRV